MNDWQPIATVPNNRIVELTTFPALPGEHEPNICFGSDLRLANPNATHWREVTAETAAAGLKIGAEDVRRDAEHDRHCRMKAALRKIANGRSDCGRPLAAETARQIARRAFIDSGEAWTKSPPKAAK